MCSRYEAELTIEKLRWLFPAAPDNWLDKSTAFLAEKKYDSFYPKSIVPVVTLKDDQYNFVNQFWGIIPKWNPKQLLTNTRSDKVFDGYAREPFMYRRCLLPASAFYEFAGVKGSKYPVKFFLNEGEPFCFAGIWEKSEINGQMLPTCSMLTTEPNSLINEFHNRMPVIVHPNHYQRYLTTPSEGAVTLEELLEPFPADSMRGELIEKPS
jgi:putative SOS response-associated peptidase YedK